jgi:hypothetical protein
MAIKSTYFMHKRIDLKTWHSPDCCTRNQIDNCLIDGKHFSDVIVIKLRHRITRESNTTPQRLRHFAVERLNDRNVVTMERHVLEAELPGASEPKPLSLDYI